MLADLELCIYVFWEKNSRESVYLKVINPKWLMQYSETHCVNVD